MIQKESLSVANICKNGQSLSSCIIAMNDFDEALYHHDASLVNGAGDNSYRYSGGDAAHQAYYSCKYKGADVSNVDGELNKSLKGDCNEVSAIFREYASQFVNKAYDEVLATKVTGQWDAVNNKCVTPSGEPIVDFIDGWDIPESFCSRDAYYVGGQWVGLINVEELGPGVETLAQPADEENQKPALYSCTYNGNAVAGRSEDNLSLKGECSTVYKIIIEIPDLIDKTFKKNKLKVKWDAENNKCITSLGNEVFDPFRNEITEEKACKGEASKFNESWVIGLRVEELGSGVETLVGPAYDEVKNYVCFGSNESPCPTDNLYRIIGVFDHKISETQTEKRVKLIKYDYANSNLLGTDGDYSTYTDSKSSTYKGELTTINTYFWNNSTQNNIWSESNLNKVNLNINYLNNIGTTWSNLIEDTTWKVSGHTTDEVTPKAMYTAEITNATKTYGPENGTSKIGLMYVSDYGFAAAPSAWTSDMSNYDSLTITSVNWMYMGLWEWTITPNSSTSIAVISLHNSGFLFDRSPNDECGVRPVLYLKASVAYAGGSGTKDSPITLGV